MLKIDTSNILFICGGAFFGVGMIFQTRGGGKPGGRAYPGGCIKRISAKDELSEPVAKFNAGLRQ